MNLHLEFSFPWLWMLLLCAGVLLIALARRNVLSGWRLYGSLALRLLVVLLVSVAVANPVYESTRTGGQSLVFVLDQSASIGEAGRSRAAALIRDILRLQTRHDAAGLVAFARTPHTVAPPGRGFDGTVPGVAVDPDATSIAGALELSLGLLPAEGARALVLLSDGNETEGQARRVADLARRQGVAIHAVPLERAARSAWGVEKLFAPARVRAGERFRLRALLTNQTARPSYARVVIRKDGAPVSTQSRVPIPPGTTPLTMDYKLDEPGLHAFDLEVAHDNGAVSMAPPVFVDVTARPRVLIVGPDASARNFFGEAMRRRPFGIEERATLPGDLETLLRYDCIVLNDVGRRDLPDARLRTLQQYVQDFGGGVVTIGGGAASSLEEFAATPLEELLPVRLSTRRTLDKKRRDFVLLLLIDRSGSMEGEKIEMAKASAINAVEALEPGDSIGIIAFDDEAHWVVEITVLGEDKTKAIDPIKRLTAGGGTDARMALVEAHRLFQTRRINIRKHLILMTDGITTRRQLLDITRRVAEQHVTISTIAIGDDADVPVLDQMRQIGGGAFYVLTRFNELPQIVVGDMGEQVKQADDIDERFVPQMLDQSPMTAGIRPEDIPSLQGYVASALKTAAVKPLMTNFRNTEDPILAHWHYGLGRSAVFTAGVNSSWSDEWLRWRHFGKLWEQIIRWTMRPQSPHDYFFRIRRDAGRLRLRVEIETADAAAPSGLRGTLQTADGRQITARFDRLEGHVFEGAFAVADSGMAQLALVEEGGSASGMWTGRVYVPGLPAVDGVSAEIDGAPPNHALLQDLARVTGGLFDPAPADVVVPPQETAVTRTLRDTLLVAALLLFLIDVAVRRLDVPYSAIRAYGRVSTRFRSARRSSPRVPVPPRPPARTRRPRAG